MSNINIFSSGYKIIWCTLIDSLTNIIFIIFLLSFSIIYSSSVWAANSINQLSPSFGSYAVGHSTMQLTRTSGTCIGSPNNQCSSTNPNVIQVDLWYPVDQDTITALSPPLTTYHELLIEQSGILTGPLPSVTVAGFIIKAYESSVIGSSLSLPPAVGKFPLIIHSHPSGAYGNEDIGSCELLASNGYIVIAPTHNPNSTYDFFLGTFTDQETMLQQRVEQLNDTMSYIMGPTSPIVTSIDKQNIGLWGYSWGNATIVKALTQGGPNMVNVKALVSISPAPAGAGPSPSLSEWEAMTSAVNTPAITLRGSDDIESNFTYGISLFLNNQVNASASKFIYVEGAGHDSFTDTCRFEVYFTAVGQVLPSYLQFFIPLFNGFVDPLGCHIPTTSGYPPLPNDTGIALARIYLKAMFDVYLKDDNSQREVLTNGFVTNNNLPVIYFQPGQTSP